MDERPTSQEAPREEPELETSGSLSEGLTRTSLRGWAVNLLFRGQFSSVILVSYTFGLFLPFITEDLNISPLKAGLLQGVWWVTAALLSLPFGAWFSRYRPVPLVLVSLLLGVPFLFLQGLANSFLVLLLARFFFVAFNVITTPAHTLLLQQWVAPRQYATVSSVALSQHSIILAIAVSTSALLITVLGSWRLAYFILGGFFVIQTLAWLIVAREQQAPVQGFQRALERQQGTPLRAVWTYPQGWLIGITMLALGATWTALVTFLPTLWEERDLSLRLSGLMLGFLYYGLIPTSLLGGFLFRKVRKRKLILWVPALLNVVLGVAITLTPYPWLLMLLITGLGILWIIYPVIQVLAFEFPGISPREVAVINALVLTLTGLGFAVGPVVTGLIAEITGSLETGLVVLCLATGIGIISGLLYSNPGPRVAAPVLSPREAK